MYYTDYITQKSWDELKKLRSSLDFVLIGGWATYIYSKTLKSKDVDIAIEPDKLGYLKKNYDTTKNDRLKKYEARRGEIQIDIYLPHYSKIGVPVEELLKNMLFLEGFKVVDINYLVVLKIFTLDRRKNSSKGRKDLIDLVSLFLTGSVDTKKVLLLVAKYKLGKELESFKNLLNQTYEIVELRLNKHAFSRGKGRILQSL